MVSESFIYKPDIKDEKMARKNPFATLSATGIKKPLDYQGVNCF
jgi:hypothetical protein